MKNIVITAGGTSEPIDKVRKITNMSKGTLGKVIASYAEKNPIVGKIYFLSPFSDQMKSEERDEAIRMIEEDMSLSATERVDLLKFPEKHYIRSKVEWIQTSSVQNVHDTLERLLTTEKIDVVIHAMAVSDYTVDYACTLEDMVESVFNFIQSDTVSADDLLRNGYMPEKKTLEDVVQFVKDGAFRLDTSSKMSSKSENLMIKLKPTRKIISKIKEWSPETTLVGFKLLENVTRENLFEVASALMDKNKCDFVFANDIKLIRQSGHQGILLLKNKDVVELCGLDNIAGEIIRRAVGEANA